MTNIVKCSIRVWSFVKKWLPCFSGKKNKIAISKILNSSRINRFRATLQACELKELHLQNRRFTWSNERVNPTLCKLDSYFCNADWDIQFDTHVLHAPPRSPTIALYSSPTIEGLVGLGASNSRTFGVPSRVSPRLSRMLGLRTLAILSPIKSFFTSSRELAWDWQSGVEVCFPSPSCTYMLRCWLSLGSTLLKSHRLYLLRRWT